ncbi:MAG: hypothetical protein NXH72_13150 [Hyphomonadaceae bacterium]|nr:hypothetical protein [Hyphomonadaceae bacterium]
MTSNAIAAQAELHHQYFLGLQLMVAVEETKQTVYDWMFRLFRRQHEDKFLSSFEKLGLIGQPHAVACAKYHVLSNGMGGVAVEYMEETETKAWVRFRYPRWMYAGPAICGIPVEASRGFLHGWYAQNGVSLGNPRLGYVCVSEDVTGQFGLCGYFKEYDHDLPDEERLVFAPDERPPAFDPAAQPAPPASEWSEERLAKANRNYAMEYVRNGLRALREVVGPDRAMELAKRAARLTGLQNYARMAAAVGAEDGGPASAAHFLVSLLTGMGDDCRIEPVEAGGYRVQQSGLRIIRGLEDELQADLLACWNELWRGTIHAQRAFLQVACARSAEGQVWEIHSV